MVYLLLSFLVSVSAMRNQFCLVDGVISAREETIFFVKTGTLLEQTEGAFCKAIKLGKEIEIAVPKEAIGEDGKAIPGPLQVGSPVQLVGSCMFKNIRGVEASDAYRCLWLSRDDFEKQDWVRHKFKTSKGPQKN